MKIHDLIRPLALAGVLAAAAFANSASAQDVRSGAAKMTPQQKSAAAMIGKRKFTSCKRQADAKKLAFGSRGPFIKECLARR